MTDATGRRRRRTIYFEDAHHYYLYVFDPPMTMHEATLPVDQVSGTAVDTFVYGVACGGLFYPSRVGKQFGELQRPFTGEYSAAFWSAWSNMQGLIEQGLDPLRVLVDRAHERHMEFIASLRMGSYAGQNPEHMVSGGGRGLAHAEVRDYLSAVLKELVGDYDVDGIELDFAAAPAALDWFFRPEEAQENTPLLTEYVGEIAAMARQARGEARLVGARVFPTEEMNVERGLDVREWVRRGYVDFVVPMMYHPSILDPDLPLDWIVEAAHGHDVAVYGFLHPDFRDETRRFHVREYATTDMLRAAAANYVDRGVDGLYVWFLPWPLGHEQRGLLTELGDWDALRKGDKHYYLRRRHPEMVENGYDAELPLQVPFGQPGQPREIRFYISDDVEAEARRVGCVTLRINISDLVSADRIAILLNGQSLAGERCVRSPSTALEPYKGQWLEFDLTEVRPRRGHNTLAISLDERPPELEADIRVDDVEILVRYSRYPSGLNAPAKR